MRTIIAGGRHYKFTPRDIAFLDGYAENITEVVSGGADGADKCGEQWARSKGIPVRVFHASWETHGKAAGPLRNEQMAQYADALIPFRGGRGTQNMIRQAGFYGLQIVNPYSGGNK